MLGAPIVLGVTCLGADGARRGAGEPVTLADPKALADFENRGAKKGTEGPKGDGTIIWVMTAGN